MNNLSTINTVVDDKENKVNEQLSLNKDNKEVSDTNKTEETSESNNTNESASESNKTNESASESNKTNESASESNKTVENKSDIKSEDKDEIKLTHINYNFIYELMAVPTVSNHEYRMVTFIILWARKNNIDYEFDDYGNVYLTKGKLNEGEFYPCVTAHLDSVQHKQKPYAQVGMELEVKTRKCNNKHEIYVDGMGIGGDDKAGILISLSMFSHVEKLKACFFLEEETGCNGSKKLNKEWFKDVGYVIGYDSPDLNRAAWACSGTKLFSAEFFKNNIQEICKEHGVTSFRSEPFTDVKEIREQTEIVCMNFGSGYYNAHASNEYCVIEDMDNACKMGHSIINKLGNKQFKLENQSRWIRTASGGLIKNCNDDDERFFDSLSGHYSYSSYYNNHNSNTASTAASTTSANNTNKDDKDKLSFETFTYLVDRYDTYINDIKDNVEKICKEKNIDFELFKEVFSTEIKF